MITTSTDRQSLLQDLEQTTHNLLQTLAAFDHEQLNKVPFAGSWTAGQVGEHLLKSVSGIPEVLSGPVIPAARPVDEMVPIIGSIFLDFNTKMKSPDFTLPSVGPHDSQQLMAGFEQALREMQDIARTADLSPVCTSFPFPQLGELTRLEWVYFGICHSKRHTWQLKNIFKRIAGD